MDMIMIHLTSFILSFFLPFSFSFSLFFLFTSFLRSRLHVPDAMMLMSNV